jgi:transcriptional regulator GlxA family with amidase domain
MSQTRQDNTSADAVRDRYRTLFANAFAPQFRYEQMPSSEERTAYAAEFVAHRLGQIDDKLERLIALMERGAVQPLSAQK